MRSGRKIMASLYTFKGGRGTRYNLMKWHISSWIFTKLDEFLPFVSYMVKWFLGSKKLCFLLISLFSKNENWIFQSLNHVGMNLKPRFLTKSGHYIIPIPSTALVSIIFKMKRYDNFWAKFCDSVHCVLLCRCATSWCIL